MYSINGMYLKDKFFKQNLNEAFELGMKKIGFYTIREPLMNLELENYINIAKKISIY